MADAEQPLWDEATRLATLRSYGILDAPVEAIFDDFVQIAAEICNAPIAIVSFVDEARQWFAAETGLGVRETPISQSVCAHAIRQPGVFVVPDLTLDPRFAANPLVLGDPNLRFYGAALLETADGTPLGTMCVLDDKPRPQGLTDTQSAALRALARQVMAQLELRRLVAEKDLLMQEVDHRVKNSMATVQSLLQLQARVSDDPEVCRVLTESAGRIRTFGAMHEHLNVVGSAIEIDVATYLGKLLRDAQTAWASTLDSRAVSFDAQSLSWPTAEAPTLGLIVNELVTNAFKYGAGTVGVRLRLADAMMILTVEDEGGGLPADFDPATSRGLGMRVVTGLLRSQQRGRLEIDRSCGHTRFVVTIRPPPAPNQRS